MDFGQQATLIDTSGANSLLLTAVPGCERQPFGRDPSGADPSERRYPRWRHTRHAVPSMLGTPRTRSENQLL